MPKFDPFCGETEWIILWAACYRLVDKKAASTNKKTRIEQKGNNNEHFEIA
ncbi:MAG: hypothetical protein K9W42_10770 [Candidatus Heimdallarchaeota archaeon]|nr:hypothetical protein [Candidatus Heimdallarchaeota archaeon]